MIKTTDSLIERIKHICLELRPSANEEISVVSAVEKLSEDFTILSGIKCLVESNVENKKINSDVNTCAYRIISEAFTNVLRHANATEIITRLELRDGKLVLSVADNGVGIPSQALKSNRSLGLLGMVERARSINGSLSVNPGPICGTIVKAILPLK